MVINSMIFVCVIFLLFIIGSGALAKVIKFIMRGGLGMLCIYFINFIMAPLVGVSVGINLLTAFIVALLGVPGFFMLYVVGWFL